MTIVCPSCGEVVEALNFCTECGTPLPARTLAVTPDLVGETATPAGDLASAVVVAPRQARTGNPDFPAPFEVAEKKSGWQTAGKVIDGVGTVITTLVGLGWLLFGGVVLVFTVPTGAFPAILIGIGFIVYGIYLMKPGGWKFVIY